MVRRVLILVGVMVALSFVLACAWILFGGAIQERMRRERFDPVAWQSRHGIENDVRIRIVDDLLRQHNFHGMARDQLTAIVGEPDQTEYFKDWDLVYWLGPERGFMSIDSEWLVFRLDDQKRVMDYQIVRD